MDAEIGEIRAVNSNSVSRSRLGARLSHARRQRQFRRRIRQSTERRVPGASSGGAARPAARRVVAGEPPPRFGKGSTSAGAGSPIKWKHASEEAKGRRARTHSRSCGLGLVETPARMSENAEVR